MPTSNLIEITVYKSLLFGLRAARNNLPQSLQTQHHCSSIYQFIHHSFGQVNSFANQTISKHCN